MDQSRIRFLRFILAMHLYILSGQLAAEEQQECIVVRNAAIANTTKLPKQFWRPNLDVTETTMLLNRGHEIGPGKGSVFALRIFKFNPAQIDSASFTKVTINMGASFKLNQPIDLRNKPGFYLSGNAAWLHHGNAGYADKMAGRLLFKRENEQLVANVIIQTTARFIQDETRLMPRNISTECIVREIEVIKLTPWEGAMGHDSHLFVPGKSKKAE